MPANGKRQQVRPACIRCINVLTISKFTTTPTVAAGVSRWLSIEHHRTLPRNNSTKTFTLIASKTL